MKKKSDAYLKVVEWSEEDQCYIGSCPGLMFGGVHGRSEKEVYEKLCKVVEEWIEDSEISGVPLPEATANRKYSGKFVLRVSEDVHKALWIRAAQRGESLNSYCKRVLEEKAL
jgi:predicted HicB family RNase H-like nuclease